MEHASHFKSIVGALRSHASTHPNDRAYVFLDERGEEAAALTFAELDRRAAALGEELGARLRPGDRALLMFPPGLDFIVAFFACQYAGVIAVPTILARHRSLRDSSVRIIEDCEPRLGLTARDALEHIRAAYAAVPCAADLDWLSISHAEFDGGG